MADALGRPGEGPGHEEEDRVRGRGRGHEDALLRGRAGLGGLDLGGAEFEFGDLAERVELRVGQDVGGGFGVAERDEDLPGATALSARAFNSIVPRRVVTRTGSPAAMPSRRSSAGARLATASGSSSSSTFARRVMAPVCQCSSWRPVVSTIGYSASGSSAGGTIAAGTSRPRPEAVGKPSPKTISSPGWSGGVARIGHRAFASSRSQVMSSSDGIASFISANTSRGCGVGPVEPDAPRDFLDDRQILARIPRQRQGAAAQLDLPVGIGDGAVLLRPGRGRQDDIGVFRGLGQEQILHDEMLELGQPARAWWTSGSDIAGFSPMMYMP